MSSNKKERKCRGEGYDRGNAYRSNQKWKPFTRGEKFPNGINLYGVSNWGAGAYATLGVSIDSTGKRKRLAKANRRLNMSWNTPNKDKVASAKGINSVKNVPESHSPWHST